MERRSWKVLRRDLSFCSFYLVEIKAELCEIILVIKRCKEFGDKSVKFLSNFFLFSRRNYSNFVDDDDGKVE